MGLINFLFCFEFLLANSPSSALVPSSFYSSFVISMSPFFFAITNAFFALWPYVSIISACTFYLPLNLIFNLSISIGVTSLSSLVPATTMASEEEKSACCCPMVSDAAPPPPEGKDVPSCYCFMFLWQLSTAYRRRCVGRCPYIQYALSTVSVQISLLTVSVQNTPPTVSI